MLFTHDAFGVDCDRAWRRQYVFAGATMPAEGTKNVADDLRERHPGAVWLAGRTLHQPQAAIQHRWRPVTEATRLATLQVGRPSRYFKLVVAASAPSATLTLSEAGLSPMQETVADGSRDSGSTLVYVGRDCG